MFMTKYNYKDKYNDFNSIFKDFNSFFDNFGQYTAKTIYSSAKDALWEGNKLSVELPGFKKDQIQITISSNVVGIVAKNKNKEEKLSYVVLEDFEPKSASAKLEDGVLTIEFSPKSKQNDEFVVEIK